MAKNRDEFSPATKRAIERQARGHCSNPACRRLTHAATSDGTGEISIGQASHICAAAPGGPRYDAQMTPDERTAADNGVWLCDVRGRAVDPKDSKFTVEELRGWKRQTNEDWRCELPDLTMTLDLRSTSGGIFAGVGVRRQKIPPHTRDSPRWAVID